MCDVAWLCDVHKKCYSCPLLSSIGCCKSAHPTNSDEVKADLKQIESVQEKWCFSSSCSCTFARLYDWPHSAPSRSPLPACPAPACSEPSILSVGVPLPYPGMVPLPYPGLEASETQPPGVPEPLGAPGALRRQPRAVLEQAPPNAQGRPLPHDIGGRTGAKTSEVGDYYASMYSIQCRHIAWPLSANSTLELDLM